MDVKGVGILVRVLSDECTDEYTISRDEIRGECDVVAEMLFLGCLGQKRASLKRPRGVKWDGTNRSR